MLIATNPTIIGVPGLDSSVHWVSHADNPIITVGAGGSWEDIWVHPYCVVDNGSGTLYMYYGGAGVWDPEQVGLATSTDGITWSKYGSNPIFSPGTGGQWDDYKVKDFHVIKDGSNWKAWYAAQRNVSPLNLKVGYATSSDGISWTRYGSNPVLSLGAGGEWDDEDVSVSDVWLEDSTYYMLYSGIGDESTNNSRKIGLATSSDGIAWVKSGSNPIFEGIASTWEDGVLDVDGVKIDGIYHMFYQGNTSDQIYSAIGSATSTDLINWTCHSGNPFPRGSNGTWDDQWHEARFLYQLNAEWYMYYMGAPDETSSTPRQIGVKTFI